MPGMENFNPLRDAVPLAEIKRVLVIKLRHHGDVLVSSPVFSALKAQAPQVEIDALVYADTAEMLTFHPAITKVLSIDRKWKQLSALGQVKAELALFNTLKARHYDLIIHLTEHWRGAWLCRLLKPRYAVVLFSPSGDKQWGPWGMSFRVISSTRHPCRPCGIDGCGGGRVSDCLISLGVDEVLVAAHELLAS